MRLKLNKDLCVGCKACEIVCSEFHYGNFNPKRSRIKLKFEHPVPGTPTFCIQCKKPKCVEVCPTGALVRDEENDIVIHYDEKCIRCGACVEACPFDGIYYNEVEDEILKCDLCNGDPMCIKICQKKALSLIK